MITNFIIISTAKTGATALYWYMAKHLQIYMSPVTETNYFADDVDDGWHLLCGEPEFHRFSV